MKPSAFLYAISPVLSHPFSVKVSFVASGLRQYPFITFGPRTQNSPLSPTPTSLPSSLTIIASMFGFSSPTVASTAIAVGSMPQALHVISVMPHPCFRLTCPTGQRLSNSVCGSLPSGAAPQPALSMEDKSNLRASGRLANATTMGGTSVRLVMRYS
jgi:hypothetical protein